MEKRSYWTILVALAMTLCGAVSAWPAGTTVPPASLGPKTLAGFGGSAGAHEFFLQSGSGWKGDLTGIGAGPTWSMVILDIDVTGVTGPADCVVYFNLQDADDGSHFKNLGISSRLDASGAAGGTLLQCFQQFTSEGLSSHGLNIGELTPADFDLRFDFTKAVTGDGWTVTPYFRLSGGVWTQFFDGPFTATVGGIDFDAGKIAIGFDSGADGSLSFGNLYVAGPASDVYVDDAWAGLPDGTPVQFPGQTEYRTIGIDAFDNIQAGVDNVSGSTVNVAAGTYTQNVVVNKALDLIGAGAATTILDGNNVGNTVTITASDVKLSGFNVIGGYSNGGSVFTPYGGVVINGNGGISALTGITIEDNIIENNSGVGVYVSAAGDGGGADNVVIRNCDILNNTGGAGISLTYPLYSGPWGSYDEWRRPKNILVEADSIEGNSDYGIYVSAGKDNVIRSNDISGSSKYGLQLAASMTYTEIPCEYTTVDSNEIYDSGRNGVKLTSYNRYNTFTGNNIYNNGFSGTSDYYKYGFLFQDGDHNVIQNNTITGNALGGLYLWGKGDPSYTWYATTDNTITGNVISNHTAAGAQGVYVPINYGNANSGFLNAIINGNSITDNLAFGLENADATSDDVDYSPWWGANYVGDPHTSPWTWHLNTTSTIQAGIDASSPGDIVNVQAGTYAERININKSLDLRGAQYGVDPVQTGARTNPAVESVLDISGLSAVNPNVAVEIPGGVTDVTLGGFTLIGSPSFHYADESVIRCWDDDLTIEDNIMDGYLAVLYKGNDNLVVRRNRVTANKNGVIVQPNVATGVILADNEFHLGSTPAGDESGMYLTSCSSCSVTGNTANGFINAKGIAGSNLDHITVSGNTFDGDKDAISFWGNTTFITISDNLLTNSLRYGISIKGQDIDITGNTITGSADAGVNIDKHTLTTERVRVTGNTITGNANYGLQVNTALVTDMVTATGNWWGDDSGPYHAASNTGGTGDAVTDGADYSPWWGGDYLGDPHTDPWVWYLNTSNSSTIQEGIDAASSGDTVNVKAGVYDENPNVNKEELALLGEDKTTTFIMTTSSSGMAIDASGVTMSGFTVKQNNPAVVQKDLYIGLSAWVSNVTVRDCIFDGTGSTKSGSMGIQVRQADGVTIENIQSFGWTGYGVNVYNAGPPFADDVLITDSDFHDNGYFGVSIDRSTNVRVRNCAISGSGGSGVAVFEDSGKPVTGAEVTGCTIQGPFGSNGILVVADSVLIQNNEISDVSDPDTRAIRITTAYWPYYSADGNMVTNNFIHDNNIGLLVDFGSYVEPTGNVIFENSFTNNTMAVDASECTQPLDASGNWWGSNEPATVGALMSGMADYTPWLHDSTDTSGDPGFQGDFSHLHVDDNSAQAGAGGRITEGVEMVAGSAVEVEPGVYDEIIEFADTLLNLTVIGNADAFSLSSDDTTLSVVTGGVIFSNTSGEISGVTLENLYIQGQQTGYRVIGNAYQHKAVKGFTLRNCVVDGEDEPGRDGIMVDSGGGREGFGGNLTIDHVEFKDILHYGVMELFDGTVVTPFDTVTFVNSWVHECDGTVALRGHASTPTASILVSGNIWENIGDNQLPTLGQHWAALEINRAQSVQIDDNTIDHVAEGEWGEGEALQMWDVGVLDVHDNHFINCYQGIFIWGNSGAFAVPAGAISYNNISGNNQYGIMLDSTATGGPLNAEANWWGHASGPYQATTNPSGSGDEVSDNVDYSPWWGDNYVGQPHPWVWHVNTSSGSTIQEAIDAAGPGDIVDVAAGTYAEYLIIAKDSLTVQGAGMDQSIIDLDSLMPYWHYQGCSSSYASRAGVYMSGYGSPDEIVENVTFKGFTVINAGLNPPGGGSYPEFIDDDGDGQDNVRGIGVANGKNILIKQCKVQNSGYSGINVGLARCTSLKQSEDVTIDSCVCLDNDDTGINVSNYIGPIAITNNTCTNNKRPHPDPPREYTGKGIEVKGKGIGSEISGLIANNVCSDNGFEGIVLNRDADGITLVGNTVTGHNLDDEGAGIFFYSWDAPERCKNHIIRKNIVTGNIRGIVAYYAQDCLIDSNTITTDAGAFAHGQGAIKIDNANNITVQDNDISCDGTGITVTGYDDDDNAYGNTFTGNTITDAQFAGIFIYGPYARDNTFTENTITGTDSLTLWGGETYQETQGDGVFLDDDAGTGNVFHHNAIYDNFFDGMECQVDTAVVDAGHNWWGHASGPYHATSNPSGSGDGVSDYVDYSPWWGANYVGDPHATPWVWYVNDVYGSTIGEAIAEATDGDTVNVSPGTYEEQIVITQSDLELLGSGSGSDPGSNTVVLAPNGMSWYFTTSADNYPIIGIDGATGVGIRRLRVDGAGRGNTNTRFVGIGFWNSDGDVDHCAITNVKDTPFSGAQHGVGIYAYNDGSKGTYDIEVSNTTVDEFQKTAMALSGAGLTITVDSCTVAGVGPTAVTAQNGVQIGYDATGVVTDCDISGIDYTGTGWSASGVLLYYPAAGMVLSGNQVSDCQGGLNAYFCDGLAMSANQWTDNEFTFVWGGDSVSVSGDEFTGNDQALYIADATNLSASENIFDGNDYAVIIDGLADNIFGDANQINNSTTCGILVQPYGADEPTGVVFHSGDISGNAFGVSNSTVNMVDAEQNWWGDASGPATAKDERFFELVRPLGPALMEGRARHAGRTDLRGRTRSVRGGLDLAFKGTGDAVSSLVDYSPWWGGNYLGDPHTTPWQWWVDTSNNSGIQEGVDVAAEGDTVNATPDLYEEQVVITKDDLALLGAGCGSDPDSASIIKSPVNLTYYFTTSADNYPIVGIDGATGVKIEDFSIDGAGRGNANTRFVGVGFWNGDGDLARCCLTGVRDEPFSGAQHGVAVYAYNNTSGPYSIGVTETDVDDFQKTALALSGNGLTVTVDDCEIAGAGSTSVTAQNGIQIGFGAGGTVTDCSVEGIAYTGEGWTASGMLFYNGTTVDVAGTCTLTDCQASIIFQETDGSATGVVVTTIGVDSEEGVSIRDYGYVKGAGGEISPLLASPFDEARAEQEGQKAAPTTVVLSDLHLTGNHGVSTYGVAAWSLGDDVDVTLTDSEIRDWEIGVVAYEDVSTVELLANHNGISSNDMGYYSNAAAMQNAMSNWWGDFYGPLQATTNPTAGGDEVSDNVDYSPWWTASYVGDPHTDPWSWGVNTSNGSGLQEGIDSASVADTVNAMADTYPENVVVNKTLVLRGAQDGVDARGRMADEALITASSGHLVDIQASDVVFDGFQVTGSISAGQLIRAVIAGSGLQLMNNIMGGTAQSILLFGTTASDVLLFQNHLDAASMSATHNLAEFDEFSAFNGLVIQDNDFYTGEIFAGNKTYNSSGLVISGNLFDGAVVKLSSQFEEAAIENNTFINNGYTNLQAGLRNSSITANTFHNANPLPWVTTPSYAVMLWGDQYGLTPSENVDLENNFFYFNEVAAPDEIAHGLRILSGIDATTIDLFDNSFVDGGSQSSALAVVNEAGGIVDASANWWSSNDPDTVKTVTGGGVDVDYTPWLDTGTDTDDPGFHGDFSTLWVDDDSPQSGAQGRVQEGVDLVTGSLVNVVTGIYEEQVEIDKTLTLLGFGVDSTFIHSPVMLSEHFTTSADNYPIIYVHHADDVDIKELTVDGLGRGNGNYRFEGIAYYNAGGTVQDCNVEDIREEPYSGNQHGVAIYAYTDTVVARTLDVIDCTISGYQKNGMALNGAYLTANVDGCQVTGYGPASFIAQNGIQLGYGATGSIGEATTNTITGHSYTPHDWAASGILVYGTSGTVEIKNNVVSENSEGIYCVDASAIIEGNDVSATQAGTGVADYWAVICDPGSQRQSRPFDEFDIGDRSKGTFTYTLEENTIDGDDGAGSVGLDIWCDGSDDLVVTGSHNTITDFDIGVQVDEETSGLVSSVILNWNHIYDNASYGVYNDAALTVDARYCWWGYASGPYHPTINAGGQGNEVSDRVLFDPWLGSESETDLVWSTFLGGGACDQGYSIAVDVWGNVYVTGYTNSLNFPTTLGAYNESHNGGSDIFLSKVDPSGSTLVYSTFLGGSASERAYGIAVDGSGNAYLTGWTQSSDFPVTSGAYDESYNGSYDVFALKMNAGGDGIDYATYLGGASDEQGYSVAVEASGKAYLVGYTVSGGFPTTPAAFDITHNGNKDGFAVKLNAAGTSLDYSTFLGDVDDDEGWGVEVDPSGYAYIVGYSASAGFPTTAGAYDRIHNGGDDAIVIKLNQAGTALDYSSFVGGSGDEQGRGIDLDDQENAYVIGSTQSSDFPVTAGAYDETYNGAGDIFLFKIDSAGGVLDFATYLGETGDDWGCGVAIDNTAHSYVTGFTGSADFPTTVGAFSTTYNGGNYDAFTARIDPAGGGLDYSTFLGGAAVEEARDIALDGSGYVHVVGYTLSSDFPATVGAFDVTYNGGTWGDAFVTQLDIGVVVDKTPPEAIDDLMVQLIGVAKSFWGHIYLSWSEPLDNIGVSHYVIYRSTVPGELGDSLAVSSDIDYLDMGAAGNAGINYFYIVKAVDAAGNKSANSNQVGEFDKAWGAKLSK